MSKRPAETNTGVPVHKVQVVELFDSLPTETSIQDRYWQEYHPTQATLLPTQFLIPPVTNFIDLSQCYLELGLKLVKSDGTDVGATEINVGVINNIAHSMIKRFDVKLNNTSTGEPTDLYHMKAYVQNLLNFSPEQKDSYLAQEGWFTDTAGKLNAFKTVHDDGLGSPIEITDPLYNTGFLARSGLFFTNFGKAGQKGREALFRIQPAVDIFQSGRFLVPQVSMDIQIDYNESPLVVMAASGATHRIQITKAVFVVRHVRASDQIMLNLRGSQTALKKTVIYPIRTTKPIRRTLEQGKLSFSFPDLFQQAVPDLVTIGMVPSTNFNGATNLSPFLFQLDSLKSVRWMVNGHERPQSRLEIKSDDKMEAYATLFQSTGNMHRGFTPGIKRQDYNHGFALMRFNFTPDGKDAKNYTYKNNQGTLDLFLEFESGLPFNYVLVLLPEFENEILVDPNTVVTMKNNY